MAVSKISNSEYFQSGETYKTGVVYISAATNGAGTAFGGHIFLPKKIPDGMTITASGSWSNVRKYDGTQLSINANVINCSKAGDNSVYLSGTGSNLSSNNVCNAVPNNITLTFT